MIETGRRIPIVGNEREFEPLLPTGMNELNLNKRDNKFEFSDPDYTTNTWVS